MRLLISIGCNSYSHFNTLYGAEQDATRIFEVLARGGDYDKDESKLLLSPTHAELMKALDAVLFSHSSIDVFTIFLLVTAE